jgi:hypothetical protein
MGGALMAFKKVTATVIYKGHRCYNLTVNHKGNLIPLIRYDMDSNLPFDYPSFQDMYAAVLNTIKFNRFTVFHHHEFNSDWYDIQFIDINNPVKINKYGFNNEWCRTEVYK